MRLWSLHPSLLDRQGLLALWREGLLAQKVLADETRGYRSHPQLQRFCGCPDPRSAIATYLHFVADEADHRGYHFARERIRLPAGDLRLTVTDGQLAYEWQHLLAKLAARSPELWRRVSALEPRPHDMFDIVAGPIASWERPA
ncbi:pyrimidine dimer DNA glycosylase/endonuclease V [Bowdeniella massiliensis]|uniref:pyrimidine dimer DNA glycosylase/endonuclease V n=1 Tax=Bowdeniella massiliensis TaxID=2932264 RepID=UPI0020298AE8|nr:pyrimidine dimer DNA glycosylase/endonuclease V [Bowdeniella massiliensis]